MMNRQKRIEQEVQRTLEQFERGERIRPNPFFYTRIHTRLRKRAESGAWVLMSRALRPALLVLLVACNIATAAILLGRATSEGVNRNDVVSAVGNELGLDSSGPSFFLTE